MFHHINTHPAVYKIHDIIFDKTRTNVFSIFLSRSSKNATLIFFKQQQQNKETQLI